MRYKEENLKLHICFLRNYKKNTAAIFFSFTLTFLLLTVMLVLLRTNFQISNLQAKMEYAPVDCYIHSLSEQQMEALKKDSEIEWIGVQQGKYVTYEKNNQMIFLDKYDENAATMTSKLIEGNLPGKPGEIAAEKWMLLNLGIGPVIGQKIVLTNYETELTEEFYLVGILSDIYQNKKSGILEMCSAINPEIRESESYVVYLKFKKGVSYKEKTESLRSWLGIDKKQIKENPARENYMSFYNTSIKIVLLIFVIGMVIFYGIYRIAIFSRAQQYGILRALGMKKRTLHKMLLLELYHIYAWSVPMGIGAGILLAHLVMKLSGDYEKEIFLFNKPVEISLIVPAGQIAVCIFLVAVGVGAVGCWTGKHMTDRNIVGIISGEWEERGKDQNYFELEKADGKAGTLFRLGCKYIFRDLKTSGFVILTICLGILLFTGLAYKAKIAESYRADTKDMNYLSGQYAMTMLHYDNIDEGISRQSAEAILELKEVRAIKTSSSLPIRVVDESGVKRNTDYYDEYNRALEEIYGYGAAGFDGENQVYKSKLCGYNKNALEALEDYVIEGGFSPDGLGEEEVILFISRTNNSRNSDFPGPYKEGIPLMDYHVGDEITYKYRKDLQTGSIEYDSMQDREARYTYRTVKIVAIVSFPYLLDCDRTVYPLLITEDKYIQKIAPDSAYQSLYLDGKQNMSPLEEMDLERKLIRAGSRFQGISTRSLIREIEQNEMLYQKQMVYIYGMAVVSFVLVMINMVNNMRYRMQIRTKEICMLRAIGLSTVMVRKMMMVENLILGVTAVVIAFLFSWPVLRYLYVASDMQAFGHSFYFDYTAFLFVATGALALCVALPFRMLKEWRSKRIIEGIGNFE